MTKRKEIIELWKDLPNHETWVERAIERLKEKEPAIYNLLMADVKERFAKLKEKNT